MHEHVFIDVAVAFFKLFDNKRLRREGITLTPRIQQELQRFGKLDLHRAFARNVKVFLVFFKKLLYAIAVAQDGIQKYSERIKC